MFEMYEKFEVLIKGKSSRFMVFMRAKETRKCCGNILGFERSKRVGGRLGDSCVGFNVIIYYKKKKGKNKNIVRVKQ